MGSLHTGGPPDPEAGRATLGLQVHRDSLNRYTSNQGDDSDKDHYLKPDDGKLGLLRVQRAKGYIRPDGLVTTWDDPIEPNPFKQLWEDFRDSPTRILTWTYDDWLKLKAQAEGSTSAGPSGNPYGM